MVIKKYCFIFGFFILLSTSYSQSQNEDYPIFQLATTPFIHRSDLALGFSYGFNYGNPGHYIKNWILPNESSNVLFNYFDVRISFLNKFSFFLGYSKVNLSIYNYMPNIREYLVKGYKFGMKWKLIKAKGFSPAFSVEINNSYPVSFSIGSTEKSFKYYLTANCNLLYIVPIPITISSGIAYEFFKTLNVFIEGTHNREYGSVIEVNSLRAGIYYSPFKFINFNVSLFSFAFDYDDVIQGEISGLQRKDKYFLISGGVNIDFGLLDN